MRQRLLLVCGLASSVVYATMTVLTAGEWNAFGVGSDPYGELPSIASRWMWAMPAAVYAALITAFGWSVWQSASANRALRFAGGLIFGFGALGLLWPFAPMHQREVLAAGGATLVDTLHLALGALSVVVMLLAIMFGADAFGTRFRFYSVASLAVLAFFGVLTFLEAPGVARGLPALWVDVWQHINIGVFMIWVAVLAIAMLRTPRRQQAAEARSRRTAIEGDERRLDGGADGLNIRDRSPS